MEKYIYVIKLEENKRLLHFSEEKSESTLFAECEIYYDYAKKYKPLVVEEMIPLMNYVDIDSQVKWYMHLYGYTNVRGGSYIYDPLPSYLEKALNHEFSILETQELEWNDPFTEILNQYQYRIYDSLEEINSEIAEIQLKLEKYNLEKERLEKVTFFKYNGVKTNIQKIIPGNMTWLYEYCCVKTFQTEADLLQETKIPNVGFYQNLKSKSVERYKQILQCLKHLYSVFETFHLFEKHSIQKTIELKYPQFVFDKYIYDRPTLKTIPSISKVCEICKIYQFMWDVVHNMSTELEYDVCSYGKGFLWKVPRIVYILEKKKGEMERRIPSEQSESECETESQTLCNA
jgi:hypothetical protein